MKTLSQNKFIILGIYSIVLFIVSIFFHETWRDELHVWIISQNSNSFLEFLQHRNTEAHPILWDLIQYTFSIFTSNFICLKLLNILFSIVTAYLFIKYLPFKIYQKVLLLFSYYFLFEYSVITRSYALSIMLLFISSELIKNKNYNGFIIISILAANTNILSAIVITSISIYYWSEKTLSAKHIIVIAIGVLLSVSHSFYQLFYNWDFQQAGYLSEINVDENLFLYKLALFYKGLVPIPIFQLEFWNTNFVTLKWYEGNFLASLLSIILMLTIGYFLRSNKKLLYSYFIGNLLLLTLFTFFWGGSQRHWGFFFILFISFYSILVQLKLDSKASNLLFTILLILQIPAGIFATYTDCIYSFSNSENVANYIDENYDKKKIVVAGFPDYTLSPIIYQSTKIDSFYNIQSCKKEVFTDWNRPENISENEFISRINKIHISNPSKKIIVILSFDSLNNYKFESAEFSFNHKKSFNSAIISDENYKLYELNFDTSH